MTDGRSSPASTGEIVNILCIDQFTEIGAGARSLIDLLPAFADRGWNVAVALPGEGPLSERLDRDGYCVRSFALGTYSSRKKPVKEMLQYAFDVPDVAHSLAEIVDNCGSNLLYVNGSRLVPPAAWVAWRKGLPLVFHCHNRPEQSSATMITGQFLELASAHVIACSRSAARPLREYVDSSRMHVLYSGIAEIGIKPWLTENIRQIGVVGRIEHEKGQLEFVHAARIVATQYRDCRFLVIGRPRFLNGGYYGKVTAAAQGLPVTFLDWQDNMEKIYSELDLLVVPSVTAQATTRVIPEAYSAGVPVVAFPVGGIPEVVKNDVTGFLTESVTAEALAQRIISVIRMDREELAAVVTRARKEWERRFTLADYRNAVCAVITKTIQLRQQGSVPGAYTARV